MAPSFLECSWALYFPKPRAACQLLVIVPPMCITSRALRPCRQGLISCPGACQEPRYNNQSHAHCSADLQASRVADSLASAEPSPQLGKRSAEQSTPGCTLNLETSQWILHMIQLLP